MPCSEIYFLQESCDMILILQKKKKIMVYGIGWDFLLRLLYHSVFIIYSH